MDPLTVVLTALVVGAAAAAKEVGVQAVKDGYAGLKAVIVHKFGDKADVATAVEQVEKKPDSEGRQTTLKEELATAGVDKDEELVSQAKALLDLLKQYGQMSEATYNAVLHGSGAIAQGPGAVAAGERGVAIGGSVQGSTIITGDENQVADR